MTSIERVFIIDMDSLYAIYYKSSKKNELKNKEKLVIKVQRKLFDLGFYWVNNGKKFRTDFGTNGLNQNIFLIIDNSGKLWWGDTRRRGYKTLSINPFIKKDADKLKVYRSILNL